MSKFLKLKKLVLVHYLGKLQDVFNTFLQTLAEEIIAAAWMIIGFFLESSWEFVLENLDLWTDSSVGS